ncbi:MAG: DUF4249 family protein [Bacteroidota bacterium]
MRSLLFPLLCLSAASLVVSCGTTVDPSEPDALVVQAYLYYGAASQTVEVVRPAPLNTSGQGRPVTDARVLLRRLPAEEDEDVHEPRVLFQPHPTVPGLYQSAPGTVTLVEGGLYQLEVDDGEQRVEATTTVPPAPEAIATEPAVPTLTLPRLTPDILDEDALTVSWGGPPDVPYLIQVSHAETDTLTFVSSILWDGPGEVLHEAFPASGLYHVCLYRSTFDLITFDRARPARRLYLAPSNVEGGFGVVAALHGTCMPTTVQRPDA